MIPLTQPSTGCLPPGRYSVEEDEIVERFVEINAHRRLLWDEWRQATNLMRSHVPVAMAWIGGSFLSDKEEPGDIDCVYFAEVDLLNNVRSPDGLRALEVIAKNATQAVLNLRVDTFLVPWTANATTSNASAPYYYAGRGWWDDFWGRTRSSGTDNQAMRLATIPRRGYLEVRIDGFQATGPVITN